MGGAVCTKIEDVGPKTKEMFELDFDMEQAELIECTEKFKLYRIKKNQNVNGKRKRQNSVYVHGKRQIGEEENLEGKVLTVKFESKSTHPGNPFVSYLPRDEKLLGIQPHQNITKIYDIFIWEESKTLIQQVFILENIQSTLRQELRMKELKNSQYTDDELVKLIEDLMQGLEFLRRKGLQVDIDVDHIYKVENDYKWASYETIGFYDHPIPISQELNNIYSLILLIVKKLFRTSDVQILRQKHPKSWRMVQQIQQFMDSNLGTEIYEKFYHLTNAIKEQDGGNLLTKVVDEINITISLKNQQEFVEQLKKFRPQELNLEILGKDEALWKTICDEVKNMRELKSLDLKSESNMISSSRVSEVFLEISNSCKMLENLSLKWSDNIIDCKFWHYFATFFQQFEFTNLKIELKNNYLNSEYSYLRQFLTNQQSGLITLHLDLQKNNISKTEVDDLAIGIAKLQMLQQLNLNLSNNYVSNYGYIRLINGITALPYISSLFLSLSKCYIEYEGFIATDQLSLLDCLSEIKLDLSNNNLSKRSFQYYKEPSRQPERIATFDKNRTEMYSNLFIELNQFTHGGGGAERSVVSPRNFIDEKSSPLPQPTPSLIEEMDENSSKATQTKIRGIFGTTNSLNNLLDEKEGQILTRSDSKNNIKDINNLQANALREQRVGSLTQLPLPIKQSRQFSNVIKQSSKPSSLRKIEEESKGGEMRRRQSTKKNPFSFLSNPHLIMICLNLNKTFLSDENIQQLSDRMPQQKDKIRYFSLNVGQNSDLRNFKLLSEVIVQLKDCIELEINIERSYYDIGDRDFIDFHLGTLLGLRKLTLNFNYIDLYYRQMINLLISLQFLSELIQLDLSLFENQLENDGFMMLGEALRNLKKLQILKLQCYKVGVTSAQPFDDSDNNINLNLNNQGNYPRKYKPNSGQSIQLQLQQQQPVLQSVPHLSLQQPPILFENDNHEIDQNLENENQNELQSNLNGLHLGFAHSNIVGASNQVQSANTIFNQGGQSSNQNIQQPQTLMKQNSIAQSMTSPLHGLQSPAMSIQESILNSMSKSISQMSSLQVLQICFSYNVIGTQGAQQLVQCLANKPVLRELRLSLRKCSIKNISPVLVAVNALGSTLKVLKLNFKDNFNMNSSIVQSNNYFQNLENLEELSLHLEYNDIDQSGIASLASNILFLTPTLKALTISLSQSTYMEDVWLTKLFDSISQCQQLTKFKLDLSKNIQITSLAGIEKLKALSNLRQSQLRLQKCNIDVNGGINLGSYLMQEEPKLQILNIFMNGNEMASPGLSNLVNGLIGLKGCLQQLTLNIESNSIEENAFQKLFYVMSEMTELLQLDLNLSNNSLSALSPSAFALIIPINSPLKSLTLTLRKTYITPHMCNAMISRISNLTNLLDLQIDLRKNMLERSYPTQQNIQSGQIQPQQQNIINIINDADKIGTFQNIQAEPEVPNQVLLVPGHHRIPSTTSFQTIPKVPSSLQLTQQGQQDKQMDKLSINHIKNPSQPTILQLAAQQQPIMVPISIPINPFESFPEALRKMEHLSSVRIDVLQNMTSLNNSLFYLTHGIAASCLKIHHIKIRSELWNLCYPSFMFYFITIRNEILSLQAMDQVCHQLPDSIMSSIFKDWDCLQVSQSF